MKIELLVLASIMTLSSNFSAYAETEIPAWKDESCYFSKKNNALSARKVLERFLESDGRGEFTKSNSTFEEWVLCPGHQGGPDSIEVISRYSIIGSEIKGENAKFTVRFEKLGLLSTGGEKGDFNVFSLERKSEDIPFELIKTPFGWRIRFTNTQYPRVLAGVATKFLSRKEWIPGDKEKFERAIKDSK